MLWPALLRPALRPASPSSHGRTLIRCRFVIISESDVPLYDPLTFHRQVRVRGCSLCLLSLRVLPPAVQQPLGWPCTAQCSYCPPSCSLLSTAAHSRGPLPRQRLPPRVSPRVALERRHEGARGSARSAVGELPACRLPACLCRAPPILTATFSPHSSSLQTAHMGPQHWRKSGQMVGLTRAHVEAALADEEVFRAFERHCFNGWDDKAGRWHDCYAGEGRRREGAAPPAAPRLRACYHPHSALLLSPRLQTSTTSPPFWPCWATSARPHATAAGAWPARTGAAAAPTPSPSRAAGDGWLAAAVAIQPLPLPACLLACNASQSQPCPPPSPSANSPVEVTPGVVRSLRNSSYCDAPAAQAGGLTVCTWLGPAARPCACQARLPGCKGSC